jgi:predicted NACHT family NTPase
LPKSGSQPWAKLEPCRAQPKPRNLCETLDLPENWQFRQLVVTPLFLHLACWMFQGEETFPSKRTAFYKKG